MNIWILNHYASILESTFASSRHYDIAECLSEEGHNVTVIAGSSDRHGIVKTSIKYGERFREFPIGRFFRFVFVKTRQYSGNGFDRLKSMNDYKKNSIRAGEAIAEKHGPPEAVIASSVHPFAWIAGERLARRFRACYITEVRDIWPRAIVDSGMAGPYHPAVVYFGYLERKYYKRSSFVITLSKFSQQHILSQGAKRVLYAPNGINFSRFTIDSQRSNEIIDAAIMCLRKNYDLIIGYAGSHSQLYGTEILLDLAEKSQTAKLKMAFASIGGGEDLKQLEKRRQERNLSNLILLGPVPKRSVPRFLVNCDILLVHTRPLETFKLGISYNKLFEYFAAKKPIVFASPGVETFPNLVGNWLFPAEPESAESILETIESVRAENSRQKRDFSALQRVIREHDICQIASKIAEEIRSS